jgi:hypothetical protein
MIIPQLFTIEPMETLLLRLKKHRSNKSNGVLRILCHNCNGVYAHFLVVNVVNT